MCERPKALCQHSVPSYCDIAKASQFVDKELRHGSWLFFQ